MGDRSGQRERGEDTVLDGRYGDLVKSSIPLKPFFSALYLLM